jgi:hypothetical protein
MRYPLELLLARQAWLLTSPNTLSAQILQVVPRQRYLVRVQGRLRYGTLSAKEGMLSGFDCRRGETTYAMGWLKWGPN